MLSIPFKMRLSIMLVIGLALLPFGKWLGLVIYGITALIWMLILKPKLFDLAKILGAELILLSLLAFPLGWEKAMFLFTRSLVCLLVMNSLLLSLPPHTFSIAMKSLPLPQGLQENALLAGQYLEILISEVTRMQQSAKCRGLSGPSSWLRYASSSMIGALYLRSVDRSERVYQAMLIRGYHGNLPISINLRGSEIYALWIAGVIISVVTLLLII